MNILASTKHEASVLFKEILLKTEIVKDEETLINISAHIIYHDNGAFRKWGLIYGKE